MDPKLPQVRSHDGVPQARGSVPSCRQGLLVGLGAPSGPHCTWGGCHPVSLHPFPGAQKCWVGGQINLRAPGLWSLVPGLGSLQTPPSELSSLIAAEDGGSPYPGAVAPTPPLFLNKQRPPAQARLGQGRGPGDALSMSSQSRRPWAAGTEANYTAGLLALTSRARGPAPLSPGYKRMPGVSVQTRPCS